jgi:hypothetical protein
MRNLRSRWGLLCAARYLPIAALLLITASSIWGQAVSQISGNIKDQTGAAIPDVQVTATQTDTGIKRTAVTDETGSYILPNLPIGPYRIEATKAGFRTSVQTGIELQVASSPVIPLTLGVGEVSQSIEVEANASNLETQKLGVGAVMENQRILDLPLNGRNATDLIALTGAAVQTGTSPVWGMQTGVTISVAGGLNYGVYYALDGAPHLNLFDSTNMPLPFPDALQEFRVETSTQNAQTGTHSGAAVNAVTKSGTNQFHGDAFEFFRNGALNARNFFAATTDSLKRNQFGGTIGGPILKNKLFFFAGYQGTTIRQSPVNTTAFVPTAAMEAGDFSVFASSTCQGKNVTLKAPFTTISGVPNQLPQSAISPVALKIATYLPKTSNPCGNVLTGNLVSQYQWQVPVRVDYQLSDKQTLFARYLGTKQNQVLPYALTPDNLLTATGYGTSDLAQSVTVGHTFLVSPTKVNSFRVSLNRIGMFHNGADFFGPSDVGINAYSYLPKSMTMTITGGPTIGSGTAANVWFHGTYGTINDDFSMVKGAHQIAFGANFGRGLVLNLANVRSIGNYTVNGQTTGLGQADFFAGLLSQMRQSAPNTLRVTQNLVGLYVQDTWKMSQRLTVNYGVRYEPFFPMQSRDKTVYTFSLDRFYQGTVSKVWTNAPPGFYYPGDPGFNGQAGLKNNWKGLSPRVGLAWDPFGGGKTAVRAGAGIAYDFVNMQLNLNADNVAPFSGDTTVNGPIPMAAPWSTTPGGNPFPYVSTPPIGRFTAGAVYLPVPPELKPTTVYTWNLGIQRQFTANWFGSASYLGSHAIHLWDNVEYNPGIYIPGNCVAGQYGLKAAGLCSTTGNLNQRRLLYISDPVKSLNISNLTAFDDGGTQSYHGLLLNTTWRATRQLNVNANYTWSHCIGLAYLGTTTPNPGSNYLHLNNRAADMGNCVADRRNNFNLTFVAQSPRFENRNLRTVASGWSLSTIYRYNSGAPLLVVSGLDQGMNGFSNQRPNQVLADTTPSSQACGSLAPCIPWLNAGAFAQPALGTLGNLGAYSATGPTYWQLDIGLSRQFRIMEGQRLEVRAEAFNLTNSLRANNPVTAGLTLNNLSNFGLITSAQDPRILQLAMKYVF